MRRTDPIIIGGGPAGSAAAITLARAGATPLILERQRETGDAICGGFLSWRTLATLERLGVTPKGHRVSDVRLTSGRTEAVAPLPGGAIGVSRRQMDQLLIDQAVRSGADLERGVTVREIHDRQVRLDSGSTVTADALFLATGKHELRGLARPRSGGPASTLGLRMRLSASEGLDRLVGDHIELHMFRGGYAGLVLLEDGGANLCLAVRKWRLTQASDPVTLLQEIGAENPWLGERMAYGKIGDVDAIAAVPYGWRARDTEAGVFRLGDQAAVIPSLAGEGNGIALASGIAAAEAWAAGGSGAAHQYQQDFAQRAALPVTLAYALWRISEHPVRAVVAAQALRAVPGLAGLLARLTRIPD